jgi:hypothetical protein
MAKEKVLGQRMIMLLVDDHEPGSTGRIEQHKTNEESETEDHKKGVASGSSTSGGVLRQKTWAVHG